MLHKKQIPGWSCSWWQVAKEVAGGNQAQGGQEQGGQQVQGQQPNLKVLGPD